MQNQHLWHGLNLDFKSAVNKPLINQNSKINNEQ